MMSYYSLYDMCKLKVMELDEMIFILEFQSNFKEETHELSPTTVKE